MSIMLLLINESIRTNKLKSIVVSHSYPHLTRGAVADSKYIINTLRLQAIYNSNDKKVTFINGSEIHFVSSDKVEGIKGMQFDFAFINEANYIKFDFFNQLIIRTKNNCFIDFNPVGYFWAHELPKIRDDAELIKLTYRDNEACPKEIVAELEKLKKIAVDNDNTYWANYARIYVDGEIGTNTDVIFGNWKIIKALPSVAKLISLGIDFGFVNDVTAIVAIYYYDGLYVIDEIAYRTKMTINDIYTCISNYDCPIYCDNSEPRTINELNRKLANARCFGVKYNIIDTINIIQGLDIMITEQSINIMKEQQNYTYKRDKITNELTNYPVDDNNHAMDAIRYAFTPIYNKKKNKGNRAII